MLKSHQHKPKKLLACWDLDNFRNNKPTQTDQMCCQLWGQIDLFVHFLCLLVSFMKMNLQRKEGRMDLLHVVPLSFLFQDLPGPWPLTKNCIYWIILRWFAIIQVEGAHKKSPLRNAAMCFAVRMLVKPWFTGLYIVLFIRTLGKCLWTFPE